MTTPAYKRILLKLSGEALKGPLDFGMDPDTIARTANEVRKVYNSGTEISIVIGGGNIFRGCSAKDIQRPTSDYMGMLATTMNALALHAALERAGVPARVMSAITMPPICEQ